MKKLIGLLLILALVLTGCESTSPAIAPANLAPQGIERQLTDKEKALDEYSGSTFAVKSTNQFEIAYPGTGSKIEIGNADKSALFKPDISISHWNGEAGFTLISPVDIQSKSQLNTSTNLSSKSVSASNGEWVFEAKATEPKAGFNEFGGFDLFITAKEKPSSNRIIFGYDTSTVSAYYQPPLTEEYKDGWNDEFQCEIIVTETQVINSKTGRVLVERPDYAVGSIALYADGKANHEIGGVNYGTGKIGQLYAMHVAHEWCRWSIDGNFLVLTIPEKVWVDAGNYPMVIAPVGDTFGYTTLGVASSGSSRIRAGKFTSGLAGTANNISIGGYGDTGVDVGAGIYSDSGGSPNAKLAEDNGNTSFPGNSGTPYWADVSITCTISASTVYWLCGWASVFGIIKYDVGSTNQGALSDTTSFEIWPDPFSAYSQADRIYSIYCDVTQGGGGETTPAFFPKITMFDLIRIAYEVKLNDLIEVSK